MRLVLVLVGAAALATAAACSKPSSTEQSAPTASAATGAKIDPAAAKEMFNSRCATCHGPNGDGNGPAAAALNPKPRNYHDKEWQKKVTDDDLKKTITYGGAAVGKSPAMPASPDLESKPEVIAGLVSIVRDFGK
jgi:mono/diheme cytochrome c family protein